jgi:oxygen-independent coproporphyrinogen III oxidase
MRLDYDLLARYDARVPRYTSYPTAPHFHDGIDSATYRALLAGLDPAQPLSLYFHIPFCAQMCWYCGCHTRVVASYEPVAAYVQVLERELDLVAAAVPAGLKISHVHWGGGTPTMLSSEDFGQLMERVGDRFVLTDDAEVAVEIDPRTATLEKIAGLGAAGVTRASLGVQDFNLRVQEAINRVQPFEMTAETSAHLRAAGINALNFDLMYGLPTQTVTDVEHSVELANSLRPDRIALFGYAHVPWMKSHQKMIDESTLPDGPARLDQAYAAADALVNVGYRRIGLDHFAKPGDPLVKALDAGTLRRNFQGYTTDQAAGLIGVGASAIGSLGDTVIQNAVPLRDYDAAIRSGKLAVAKGIRLSADDFLRRDLIERLMCDMRVDVAAVCSRHGVDPSTLRQEYAGLTALIGDGLVELAGDRITVTELGRPLVRSVCAVFDRYLNPTADRHSQAV